MPKSNRMTSDANDSRRAKSARVEGAVEGMVLAAMSFQATYTCSVGPVVTVAPDRAAGPFGSSIDGC